MNCPEIPDSSNCAGLLHKMSVIRAAASARLCVETPVSRLVKELAFAAASARLCVETQYRPRKGLPHFRSRLRAAVC